MNVCFIVYPIRVYLSTLPALTPINVSACYVPLAHKPAVWERRKWRRVPGKRGGYERDQEKS